VTARQALFIAPCSHIFHFKCLRPMLSDTHYPAFICPVCRSFADLDDDVEVEVEVEVEEEIEKKEEEPTFSPADTPVIPGPSTSRAGGEETDVENELVPRDREVTLTSRMRRRTLNPNMTLDEAAELVEAEEEDEDMLSDEGVGTSGGSGAQGSSSEEGRGDAEIGSKRKR